MRVGEGRVISCSCTGCLSEFKYYPHPYCYEDVCIRNVPIVYKPSGMGQELKRKDELNNK
jgi:hypothetical protein